MKNLAVLFLALMSACASSKRERPQHSEEEGVIEHAGVYYSGLPLGTTPAAQIRMGPDGEHVGDLFSYPGPTESISSKTLQDDIEKQVAEHVARLGADSVEERETSQKALVDLGEAAIPVLEKLEPTAKGEIRDRIRSAIRQLYRVRSDRLVTESIRTLAVRWKDVWFVFTMDGGLEGYWHVQVSEEKEALRIREDVELKQCRDDGIRLGWTSEVRCKRDRWLTSIQASCTTRVEGKRVMEVALEFQGGKVMSTWTTYRNDEKEAEVYDPPRKGTRELEIGDSAVLQTAALPFYSLFGRSDNSVAMTFIEFPDDLDKDISLELKKVEYLGIGEVEIEGKRVEAFRYRAHFVDEFLVTRDGLLFPRGMRRVSEKEAKALLEK